VPQRVLDERLEDQRRDQRGQCRRVDPPFHREPVVEPHLFDFEVLPDELQFMVLTTTIQNGSPVSCTTGTGSGNSAS
jgi:hypothetical protein